MRIDGEERHKNLNNEYIRKVHDRKGDKSWTGSALVYVSTQRTLKVKFCGWKKKLLFRIDSLWRCLDHNIWSRNTTRNNNRLAFNRKMAFYLQLKSDVIAHERKRTMANTNWLFFHGLAGAKECNYGRALNVCTTQYWVIHFHVEKLQHYHLLKEMCNICSTCKRLRWLDHSHLLDDVH